MFENIQLRNNRYAEKQSFTYAKIIMFIRSLYHSQSVCTSLLFFSSLVCTLDGRYTLFFVAVIVIDLMDIYIYTYIYAYSEIYYFFFYIFLKGSPYVAPSEIVQKIMERLREHDSHEADTSSYNHSEQCSPSHQNGRLSVLSPDNRQFLEQPRSKSPDMRNKRMIIGKREDH